MDRLEQSYRVLVCGSRPHRHDHLETRDFTIARQILWRVLKRYQAEFPRFEVIHGNARGIDTIARQICSELAIPCTAFMADWTTHLDCSCPQPLPKVCKYAGLRRNLQMLRSDPQQVLAFWDGWSNGTKHTITQAQLMEIPVSVYSIPMLPKPDMSLLDEIEQDP